MSHGPRLGVRARVTLIAAAASVVTLVLGGWLLYRSLTSTLDAALSQELMSHALDVRDEVARAVPPSLGSGIETQVLDPTGSTVQPAGEEPLLGEAAVATASHQRVAAEVDQQGRELRIVAVPAPALDGRRLVVVSAASTAPITNTERRLVLRLAVAGGLMAAATASAAWLLSGAALWPVRSMTRRARTMSTEDPQERLPVPPGSDEIAELGSTLNEMLARIGDARARERAFIDDASHELRAPLAVMRGELELALLERGDAVGDDRPVDDGLTRALESSLEEADRLARLTDHLLVLARADAGMLDTRLADIHLLEQVRTCAERVSTSRVTIAASGVDQVVRGDPVAIEQLVTNLLVNAQRWASTTVQCEITDAEGSVVLRVSDDGPGFPDDYLDHAFDRFRRGDPARPRAGASTGLGLAIAAAVVTAHGGAIRLGNDAALGGAWVEVALPAVSAGP